MIFSTKGNHDMVGEAISVKIDFVKNSQDTKIVAM